jgi:hypothetical protein
VSRDCLELSKTIGITAPAEAVEKERLQREAVALRRSLLDGTFAARADLAEAYGFLAHLLVATGRPAEGDKVMRSAVEITRALEADFPDDPVCRHKVVLLESLFAYPRYCKLPAGPAETIRACRSVLDAKARLVAEFPFVPDFRADLASSHFSYSGLLRLMDRRAESESEAQQSLDLLEGVVKDHPTVEPYQRLLASVRRSIGMNE